VLFFDSFHSTKKTAINFRFKRTIKFNIIAAVMFEKPNPKIVYKNRFKFKQSTNAFTRKSEFKLF